MSTVSGHRTFQHPATIIRPRQAPGRRTIPQLVEALRKTWRRGGEMSQTVDEMRDAAWRLSGATNHRMW
ncbi:hypothetical protein [Sinomonas sp.]|jgi:hypothetical protein|uniref:hypothetical protein n=1 Tax=Sinomonas sp. TaxID=1914986 RepID=UPI003F7FF505